MELSFSCNSLLQLQSELGTSCSGLSEQDYIGSGLGFRGSSDFGRFKLLKELNSGATATVYEAAERCSTSSDWSGSNHIALKVLNSRPGGGYVLPPSIISQEIDCAKRLKHPHIANLLDVVAHDGNLALAFELVRGPDLLDYIKGCHNRVPEQLALHYFKQLLSAVRHMHSRGIAHRDLKPENCMIDPQTHTLKVIDFGLAAPLDAQFPPGCGTLNTIAPECIVQEGKTPAQDPVAVDVWGLGVTLYITLVGRFPFQDSRRPHSDQQQVYNTLKGKLNPIPDRISGPAQELVLSMLQTDPSKRPSLEQIATHSCVTSMQPLDAAFQFEARMFGGASSLYPYSPSSDSANSDQTSDNTPSAEPSNPDADKLNFMLERYLTSNGIERQPRLLKDVKDRSSKPKQKGSTSALQPEIVEAALMHEAQEEAIQSLESKRADDVPVHTPQVVSAFSEASQSQDYGSLMSDMPGCEYSPPDEGFFGMPMGDDENSWQSERCAVKLFTVSQDDISQSPASSTSNGLENGRWSCRGLGRLASVPEANENIEEEEEENLDDSHDDKAAEQDEEDNPMSYSLPTHHRKTTPYSREVNSEARIGKRALSQSSDSLRSAVSHDIDRIPPLGPRLQRKTVSDYPACPVPSCWQ